MFQNIGGGKKKSRKLKISEALKLLTDEEAARFCTVEEVVVYVSLRIGEEGLS